MPHPNPVERLADLDAVLWSIDNRRQLEDLAYESVDEAQMIDKLKRLRGFTDQQCDLVLSSSARRLTEQYGALLRKEREEVLQSIQTEAL